MPDDSAFIGQIMLFAGHNYKDGVTGNGTWLPCDGKKLEISKYQALYSVIGHTYGGDGRKDFALPDLRGAVPVGANNGGTMQNGASSYDVGATGGKESVSKTYLIPLPEHTHTAKLTPGPTGGPAKIEVDDSDTPTTNTNYTAAPYDTATSKGNMLGRIFNLASALKAFVPPKTTGHFLGGVSGGGIADAKVSLDEVGVKNASLEVALDTRQPYMALPYYICVEGNYPSQLD